MKIQNSLKEIAHEYGRVGIKIFPLQRRGKKPLTPRGFHDASADPSQIEKWWTQYAEANIGIPTGRVNNLFVIDADIKSHGLEMLSVLKAICPGLENCFFVKTGGGGQHLYLKWPENSTIKNVAGILQGIDIRTTGGYVVGPGSIHETESKYETTSRLEDLSGLSYLPASLQVLLENKKTPSYFQMISTGNRNDKLFKIVCFLMSIHNFSPEILKSTLDVLNSKICEEKLPDEELVQLLGSALKFRDEKVEEVMLKGSAKAAELFRKSSILFHTHDNTAYAKFGGTISKIQSKEAKLHLQRLYYKHHKRIISDSMSREALQLIEGEALYDSNYEKVFVRVGKSENSFYFDLLNGGKIVEVTKGRWKILDSGINFVFKPGMLSLPIPEEESSFNLLESPLFERWVGWDSPNIMILAFIIKSLTIDTGPYPILVLTGEQGAGKSVFCDSLRALIDPNIASKRSCPRKEEDFILMAANSHMVVLDNSSGLSSEQSDWLCRLATGGGLSRRKLYSDDEEHISNVIKPVIINGINSPSTRGDFLERAIIIDLPKIKARKSEKELNEREKKLEGIVFGSLLTLLAQAWDMLDGVVIKDSPRMADFCTWGVAIEKVLKLPEGTFLRNYKENQSHLSEKVIDSSPFAVAIVKLICNFTNGTWKGNASELLESLKLNDLTPIEYAERKYWPISSEAVGRTINRIAPALFQQSISIKRTKRDIIITKESENEYTRSFTKSYSEGNGREIMGGDNASI
jgi:hypothetical protein